MTDPTAEMPVQTNGSKNLTSALINLTNQVSGALAIANGGTNSSTLLSNNKLIDFFKKSHAYVKKNRLVSKALKDHGFSRASSIAGILGYGKRKRTVRRRRVGGNKILDFLKKGHAYVKKQRLISKALKDHGFKRASNIAGVLGYGRQPIRRRRRTICQLLLFSVANI